MKKYIVRTGEGAAFNAASKARRDADAIALRLGYAPFAFRGARTADRSVLGAARLALDGLANWRRLIREAEAGSLVLIQYPHSPMKSALLARRMLPVAQKKGIRFIALVHDLDSLRGLHGKAAVYSDEKLLPLFDAVICHNARMVDHLQRHGVPREKLVELGLFDYLTDAGAAEHRLTDGVAVAGNLSPEKCGYVDALIKGPVEAHLYGKGLEDAALPKQAHLHGAFPPEALPAELTGGFGLVWDGPSASGCKGPSGEYLRYNNPHKFSLYMASGLPVVIWKEAALADFARANGVGIAIGSLDGLEGAIRGITEKEYEGLCLNAAAVGRQARSGAYLARALKRAESLALRQD